MPRIRNSLFPLALTFAVALFASPAGAHFPFVLAEPAKGDARGNGASEAQLVLSEVLEPDPAVSLDRLAAGTRLWLRDAAGKDTPLSLTAGEHAMKVALPPAGSNGAARLVHGTSDFGVRKRGEGPAYLLVYYPKAVLGDPFATDAPVGGVPVELVPGRADGGIRFRLLIDGKPAADREVKIIAPDGVQSTQKTDGDGYTEKFAAGGRYGAWARHWVDKAGKRGDAPYAQERLYATLVVDHAAPKDAHASRNLVRATPMVNLPEGVSSFGAAAANGWLYVYGGHTATTHNYSTATVSGRFHRLNLRDGKTWEPLPGGPILQGMNLVAHRGSVYRAGGMAPRNAPGAPKDNHSTAEVARFDPTAAKWEALPPAPSPRSSHDVAVVGDKLYLLGGWNQRGREKAQWLSHADVLDLSSAEKKWSRIEQPFVRRALIVSALGDEIYVIGGFDENNQSQLDVDVLDTKTNTWRKGPPIPGERRNGFGPAACTTGGTIYVSVSTGEMFRLSADRTAWEPYAMATPRAVHRLVPDGDRILVVGGAKNQKMVDLIESVPVGGATAGGAIPAAASIRGE